MVQRAVGGGEKKEATRCSLGRGSDCRYIRTTTTDASTWAATTELQEGGCLHVLEFREELGDLQCAQSVRCGIVFSTN